jgi:hypothetical protein
MRFICSTVHKKTKRKLQRHIVGAESIGDIPDAVPGFEVTDVRDENDKPIADWKKQIADAETTRKKAESEKA